jgi:hypothetical protein
MLEVMSAIMNHLSGSSVHADVGGRIYLDLAPANAVYPHIVYSLVTETPNDTFTEFINESLVQFVIYSDSKSAVEIGTICDHLKTLFDDALLAVSGNTNVWTMRQSVVPTMEDVITKQGTHTIRAWYIDYSILNEVT